MHGSAETVITLRPVDMKASLEQSRRGWLLIAALQLRWVLKLLCV